MERGEYENVLNVPIPQGYRSREYRQTFGDNVFLLIQKFLPDMLIISAGFDAHRLDPLAGINLSAEDFSYLTSRCLEIRPNVLLGLEGGYNLDALEESCIAVVNELV